MKIIIKNCWKVHRKKGWESEEFGTCADCWNWKRCRNDSEPISLAEINQRWESCCEVV